jgi:hypothetical protein
MGIFKWMLRTGVGSPGDTTRVLTKNYYSLFYEGSHTVESAYNLLNFRNNAYLTTRGIGLDAYLIKTLSEEFYNEIPILIFCISYYDNFHKENQRQLYIKEMNVIFEVIIGEYNKLCPINERKSISNYVDSMLIRPLSIMSDNLY